VRFGSNLAVFVQFAPACDRLEAACIRTNAASIPFLKRPALRAKSMLANISQQRLGRINSVAALIADRAGE